MRPTHPPAPRMTGIFGAGGHFSVRIPVKLSGGWGTLVPNRPQRGVS